MSISFSSIPSALRVPFVAAEIDASQANQGPALLAYRGLIIGQKLAAGAATADTLVKVSSEAEVITQAGRGSMLHRQYKAWRKNNTFSEVYLGVLADDGGGTAASGTIIPSGTATAAGTIALYLGGERITVAVASGDSAATVAAAIDVAINANLDLPVTSGEAAGTVTVTHRHKGEIGNEYDMRHSYNDGEELPAGISLPIVALASGATNPTLTTLIAAMGDQWFQILTHPYLDATSLTALETEMASRFGSLRMIDGLMITGADRSLANLTTLGNGRNSPHSSIVASPGNVTPRPPSEIAAEVAGQVALSAQNDPAKPLQTLPLPGALAPAEADDFTLEERNNLLFDGIATTKVGSARQLQIERLITTYQTNASAVADTAYLDATTVLTLLYLRYSWRVRIQSKYPRHKLADDGTRVGSGQEVITPAIGKAEAYGWFRQMESLGLVENFDLFKANLVVERNGTDPNRLDVLLPPDLINQLIVTATKISYRL